MKTSVLAFAGLALLGVSCASEDTSLLPRSGITLNSRSLEANGIIFTQGDRVRIKSRAGTFKPTSTGHTSDVGADAGKTGIVLGGLFRDTPLYPGEPPQIAFIRFDAQTWKDATGAEVPLKEFEASIHVDYIEAMPK